MRPEMRWRPVRRSGPRYRELGTEMLPGSARNFWFVHPEATDRPRVGDLRVSCQADVIGLEGLKPAMSTGQDVVRRRLWTTR